MVPLFVSSVLRSLGQREGEEMISVIDVAKTGVATVLLITVDQFITGCVVGNAVEGRAEWRCCSCAEEMREEQVNMHEARKRAVDSHDFRLIILPFSGNILSAVQRL